MGKIGPFVGKDETIGQVVRIGPFVGIGLFGGTGPVVSLTYIYIYIKQKDVLFPVLFYSVLATLMKKKSFVKDLFPVAANLHI